MSEICQMHYMDSEFLPASEILQAEIQTFIDQQLYPKQKQELRVFLWTKIPEFKEMIVKLEPYEIFTSSQLRLFYKNIQLTSSHKSLFDYNITSGSVIEIKIHQEFDQFNLGTIKSYKIFPYEEQNTLKLIIKSQLALKDGKYPILTTEGTSGSYLIENQKNQKISIFKPHDQEVNAPNNPRGYNGTLGSDGICRGILSGECATREVATYLLDSLGNNFHDVPATAYIQFYHPLFSKNDKSPAMSVPLFTSLSKDSEMKQGSLQQYINNNGIVADYGSSKFSTSQIHKIGILDIRILNCDRNDGNILVQQSNYKQMKLIPIDHGLSFPDNLQIYEESIVWMSYNQSKIPFSEEQLNMIQRICPIQNAKILSQKLGFRGICLRNVRLAEIFLKRSASNGFTLYQIGKMIYRTDENQYDEIDKEGQYHRKIPRSKFQQLVIQAQNLYLDIIDNEKQNNMFFEETEQQTDEGDSDLGTADSWKNVLHLKKKISLPTLKKRTTSFHTRIQDHRKQREGVNGVKKAVKNKYQQQHWTELFYHYFEDLVGTFLTQKSKSRSNKKQLQDISIQNDNNINRLISTKTF